MTIDVATYEAPGHPLVSIARDGDVHLVVVGSITFAGTQPLLEGSIKGLAPKRTMNEEEQAFGITSLDPPAGQTRLGIERLIDIAVRATQAAVESTIGIEPDGAATIGIKLGFAVRRAFELLPDDGSLEGFGSVYEA